MPQVWSQAAEEPRCWARCFCWRCRTQHESTAWTGEQLLFPLLFYSSIHFEFSSPRLRERIWAFWMHSLLRAPSATSARPRICPQRCKLVIQSFCRIVLSFEFSGVRAKQQAARGATAVLKRQRFLDGFVELGENAFVTLLYAGVLRLCEQMAHSIFSI